MPAAGWKALGQWGEDAARIEPLAGGVANDVWSVRVRGHPAVGRLGARSDADLAWETELLQHLDREGLTVPRQEGQDFASQPSKDDAAATRTNMLSAALLNAGHFPTIKVTGKSGPVDAKNSAMLDLSVQLAGHHIKLTIPATLKLEGISWRRRARPSCRTAVGPEAVQRVAGVAARR